MNQRRKKKDTSPKSKTIDDKLAEALTAARADRARNEGDDIPAEEFRTELFARVRKLIPKAIEQAEKGKPALLRILCRYTK